MRSLPSVVATTVSSLFQQGRLSIGVLEGANPFLGTRAEYRQKCTRFSTMPGAVRTHMAVLTVPHGVLTVPHGQE
jgi:hypothetical protein